MDTNAEELGHAAIATAVASVGDPCIVIEATRQLGDVLHTTLAVRHVRKTEPDAKVVLAVMEPYADSLAGFGPEHLGPHAIARLPVVPIHPDDIRFRHAWVERARTLPGVRRAFGCGVGPWGWRSGSIVDATLINAGITSLAVERRPWLPVLPEDNDAARQFILDHDLLRGFVTLEYCSYSIAVPSMLWYAELVEGCHLPVVALGSSHDPVLHGAVDGRGTSVRVAKALIARSSCFVGCGSGLSLVAASNGCEQPVIELVDKQLSLPHLGYRPHGPRYRNCYGGTTTSVLAAIRQVGMPT